MKTRYTPPAVRVNLLALFLLMSTSVISHAAPPSTPLGFRSDVYSDTAAELFWLRSSDDGWVIGYELTKDGEVLGVFDALSYFDDTLIAGDQYEYTITAIDDADERSQTVSVMVGVPGSPLDQVATLQREVASLREQLSRTITRPVAATGQTTSYFPGDDGFWQKGYSISNDRFVLNVNVEEDVNGNGQCDGAEVCNGTVTDNLTELVWLQNANCTGLKTMVEALQFANELSSHNCGLNDGSQAGDWRLPNINELISLADFSVSPVVPAKAPFLNVVQFEESGFPEDYWSSTSTSGDNGYTFAPLTGWVDRFVATARNPAWAVR